MLFAAVHWSRVAHSGHSRHRNNLVAIGQERTTGSAKQQVENSGFFIFLELVVKAQEKSNDISP
jgi:hypothetical protein